MDLLTEVGHYVVTARDGQEALLLAQERVPDLIISNLKNEEYCAHAEQAEGDLFMSKPIQAEDLFQKVQALIAHAPR